MIADVMIFLAGVALFVGGPFLAVYSYQEGTIDAAEAFVAAALLVALGIGFISGFAG